jgi:hypothetical protein
MGQKQELKDQKPESSVEHEIMEHEIKFVRTQQW